MKQHSTLDTFYNMCTVLERWHIWSVACRRCNIEPACVKTSGDFVVEVSIQASRLGKRFLRVKGKRESLWSSVGCLYVPGKKKNMNHHAGRLWDRHPYKLLQAFGGGGGHLPSKATWGIVGAIEFKTTRPVMDDSIIATNYWGGRTLNVTYIFPRFEGQKCNITFLFETSKM